MARGPLIEFTVVKHSDGSHNQRMFVRPDAIRQILERIDRRGCRVQIYQRGAIEELWVAESYDDLRRDLLVAMGANAQ